MIWHNGVFSNYLLVSEMGHIAFLCCVHIHFCREGFCWLVTMVLSMCLLFPAKEMVIIVAVVFFSFFCTNPLTHLQVLGRLKIYFCNCCLVSRIISVPQMSDVLMKKSAKAWRHKHSLILRFTCLQHPVHPLSKRTTKQH